MKKWYSLAQRKQLNQIQCSVNLPAFSSCWIQEKEKLGFQRRDILNWKKWTLKQIQSCSPSTTAYFFPYLYQSNQIASVVFNLVCDQLSLTIVHVLLTGSYSIFWHCQSQSYYRTEWHKQPLPCLFLICMEQEVWWNVLGAWKGRKGCCTNVLLDPAGAARSSLASSLCPLF